MEYKVIYSNRKTICAQISRDGTVFVRTPRYCPEKFISRFVALNEAKILKMQMQIKSLPPIPQISKKEKEQLRKKAADAIFPRVEYWANRCGFEYESVKITSARKRFGSCSSKKHLCFSLFLALCSDEEIDYVILHELCHTVEMNHSNRFYHLIEQFMPDWKNREANLKKVKIPLVVDQ